MELGCHTILHAFQATAFSVITESQCVYFVINMKYFRATDKISLKRLIVTGRYNMYGLPWYEVSEAAKDLIKRMLTIDPKRRITVEGILDHPWIKTVCNLMLYFSKTYKCVF